jgi:hypothetical protein
LEKAIREIIDMQKFEEALAERAVINLKFARAELVKADDAEGTFRALAHIDEALFELTPLAPSCVNLPDSLS